MSRSRRNSFLRRDSYSRLSFHRSSLLLDWPWRSTNGFDNDLEATITALPAIPSSQSTSSTATPRQVNSRPSSTTNISETSTPLAQPQTTQSIALTKDELHSPDRRPAQLLSATTTTITPVSAAPLGPPGPPGGWLSQKMSQGQEIAFVIMVCMVQLIPQACLTTCFPIIRVLTDDLGVKDPATLPWVVAAYAISFGTTILLAGRIGDIFGHKNLVVAGFCWLAAFSVLAAASHYISYDVFFVARAMQGVGAAMMNPNALALLGRSYPPGSKGKIIAFSAFGLCAPLGAYSGMLGSAILGQLAHWTWCFYALAIVSVVLAVAAFFILPSPPKTPKQMLPFTQKLGQMDWLGGITGVCGLVAIQVALISAPVQSWKTQYIFMLLIIGILLLIFFVIIEMKVSGEPLVPFALLNSKVAFVLTGIACGWGTFGVWTFYLWRYLLVILQDTPIKAALHVLPIVPVAIVAAALTAVLMRRTKPAWILFWALVAFTLGPMFLSLNHAHVSYWSFTFLSLLVTPFGMDMSFPSATFIMSNSLPIDKQGVAGSLVTTVVNYSISLGLGLASTVEVHVNDHGRNIFEGIRGGWFMGIGIGCLGVVICTMFVIKTILDDRAAAAASATTAVAPKMEEKAFANGNGRSASSPKVPLPPTAVVTRRAPANDRPQRPSNRRNTSSRSFDGGSWSGRNTLVQDPHHDYKPSFRGMNSAQSDSMKELLLRDSARRSNSRMTSKKPTRRMSDKNANLSSKKAETIQQRDMEPALRLYETWSEVDGESVRPSGTDRSSLEESRWI